MKDKVYEEDGAESSTNTTSDMKGYTEPVGMRVTKKRKGKEIPKALSKVIKDDDKDSEDDDKKKSFNDLVNEDIISDYRMNFVPDLSHYTDEDEENDDDGEESEDDDKKKVILILLVQKDKTQDEFEEADDEEKIEFFHEVNEILSNEDKLQEYLKVSSDYMDSMD